MEEKGDAPKSNEQRSNTLHQYVILKALDEKEVSRQNFDDKIELYVTQVRCEYVISFPTGEKNLSVDMKKDLPSTPEAEV